MLASPWLSCAAGADFADSLAAAFAAAADSSSSSGLGRCLLGDLAANLTPEQAIAPLQQWTATTAAGTDPTEALQGLAPAWQPPGAAKKPTKPQRAAVDRLRGLVLLGRAAATASPPEQVLEVRESLGFFLVASVCLSHGRDWVIVVLLLLLLAACYQHADVYITGLYLLSIKVLLLLQLLLEASGVLPELRAAIELNAAAPRRTIKDQEDLRKLRKRIGNLETLVKLARNTAAYTESPVHGLPEVETATGFESADGGEVEDSITIRISSSDGQMLGVKAGSSSSSRSQLPLLQPTTGLPLLQQLYDYCVLQGEDDEGADNAEKVQLMTMHASKGKEFACVSVLRVFDGCIPSLRMDGPAGQLEQERNLLYVAITRAKE
jgi:hypothetical protein